MVFIAVAFNGQSRITHSFNNHVDSVRARLDLRNNPVTSRNKFRKYLTFES